MSVAQFVAEYLQINDVTRPLSESDRVKVRVSYHCFFGFFNVQVFSINLFFCGLIYLNLTHGIDLVPCCMID